MANILTTDDATRIAEIDALLSARGHERRRYQAQLKGFNVNELLILCDEALGAHGLRGTGPRTKPRATDLIARLVDNRFPVRELEREKRRLQDRATDKGETSCANC